MPTRKTLAKALPPAGRTRMQVKVDDEGLTVWIPWGVVDTAKAKAMRRMLKGQVVVDNLGDLGYGGDER